MCLSVCLSVSLSLSAPSVKSQLDVSDSCVDAGFDACCDSGCSVGNCFCDMACHSFDDCCDDIQQTCPRSLITCCFFLLLLPQPLSLSLSLSPGFRECVSIYIISDGVPEPDPEQFTVNLSTDNVLVSIEKKAAVVFIFEGKSVKFTRFQARLVLYHLNYPGILYMLFLHNDRGSHWF